MAEEATTPRSQLADLAGCNGEDRRQNGHRQKSHGHGNCASRDDNPLLRTIVGERLFERSYLNACRSADHFSRDLLQGTTQEQTTPFCDQLTTPRTTAGFMAAGLFNGGQMIALPPPFSKKLQVTGKRS